MSTPLEGYTYLASPYSHRDKDVMEQRFQLAEKHAAFMLTRGITIYSPIVHMHELALRYKLPKDFDFWRRHNHNMLWRAKDFHILTIDGWRSSKGVTGELAFAKWCEKKIFTVDLLSDPRDATLLQLV